MVDACKKGEFSESLGASGAALARVNDSQVGTMMTRDGIARGTSALVGALLALVVVNVTRAGTGAAALDGGDPASARHGGAGLGRRPPNSRPDASFT
jgi:hypothetical protein